MTHIRAFISGMIFPSLLLPFVLFIGWSFGKAIFPDIPVVSGIPLIWGAWNVFYFVYLKDVLPGNVFMRLGLAGACLGFIVALFGVFVWNMPIVVGVSEQFKFAPLIMIPILYALVWMFIVKRMNVILGLSEG